MHFWVALTLGFQALQLKEKEKVSALELADGSSTHRWVVPQRAQVDQVQALVALVFTATVHCGQLEQLRAGVQPRKLFLRLRRDPRKPGAGGPSSLLRTRRSTSRNSWKQGLRYIVQPTCSVSASPGTLASQETAAQKALVAGGRIFSHVKASSGVAIATRWYPQLAVAVRRRRMTTRLERTKERFIRSS